MTQLSGKVSHDFFKRCKYILYTGESKGNENRPKGVRLKRRRGAWVGSCPPPRAALAGPKEYVLREVF
jgi:hypothetical protein